MILIADDNADVRRMVRNLIEDIDPEIVECADGEQAIADYEKNRADLVVMDINMHPLDGLTAMRTILERDPAAKVVVVSQHQDARTRDTALAMGAYAFIGKEDLMQLRELINEEIGDRAMVANVSNELDG
jgi:DNA-binding NarL/FixJ family response regulator